MPAMLFLTLAFTVIRASSLLGTGDNSGAPTAQILKELRALPQDVRWLARDYYDTHGNANEGLQTLMIRRFEATAAICHELDSVSIKSHPAYIDSLYRVLGTVKDPASIPWLERGLEGPGRQDIYDHWLPEWHAYLRSAAPEDLNWLTGAAQWSQFFRDWAAQKMEFIPKVVSAIA